MSPRVPLTLSLSCLLAAVTAVFSPAGWFAGVRVRGFRSLLGWVPKHLSGEVV